METEARESEGIGGGDDLDTRRMCNKKKDPRWNPGNTDI